MQGSAKGRDDFCCASTRRSGTCDESSRQKYQQGFIYFVCCDDLKSWSIQSIQFSCLPGLRLTIPSRPRKSSSFKTTMQIMLQLQTDPARLNLAGFTSDALKFHLTNDTFAVILGYLAVAALFRVQILSFFTKFPLSMASSVPQRNGERGNDPMYNHNMPINGSHVCHCLVCGTFFVLPVSIFLPFFSHSCHCCGSM